MIVSRIKEQEKASKLSISLQHITLLNLLPWTYTSRFTITWSHIRSGQNDDDDGNWEFGPEYHANIENNHSASRLPHCNRSPSIPSSRLQTNMAKFQERRTRSPQVSLTSIKRNMKIVQRRKTYLGQSSADRRKANEHRHRDRWARTERRLATPFTNPSQNSFSDTELAHLTITLWRNRYMQQTT